MFALNFLGTESDIRDGSSWFTHHEPVHQTVMILTGPPLLIFVSSGGDGLDWGRFANCVDWSSYRYQYWKMRL